MRTAILLLCATLLSCTSAQPFRFDDAAGEQCKHRSAEKCGALLEPIKDSAGNFVTYLEFDDQGGFASQHQLRQLHSTLAAAKAQNRCGLIVITYVHGWNHNASAVDKDVHLFRNVIAQLGANEKLRAARLPSLAGCPNGRTMVGVYMGWRGQSISVPVLADLTFWGRRAAADRVSNGGMNIVLSQLQQFRQELSKDSLLIFVGHSFGGAILYSGLMPVIANRLSTESTRAKPLADFVVLINPAFEASRFEPFHSQVKDLECYPPFMMMITSKSDNALRVFFRLGRIAGSLAGAVHTRDYAHYQMATTSVGFHRDFVTHDLRLATLTEDSEEMKAQRKRYPQNAFDRLFSSEPESSPRDASDVLDDADAAVDRYLAQRKEAAVEVFGEAELVPRKQRPKFNPIYVVQAEADVINGHNDLASPQLINFLETFAAYAIDPRVREQRGCGYNEPAMPTIPTIQDKTTGPSAPEQSRS